MTNLTTKQIEQAQDLIEKYGFCSLETQKELAKAGFFEKVKVNFCLNMTKYTTVEMTKYNGIVDEIPMPQMGEVWKKALPQTLWSYSLNINKGRICYVCSEDGLLFMLKNEELVYADVQNENPTEAMCQLWLLLHKENLL